MSRMSSFGAAEAERRRDRVHGLAVVGVAFLVSLLISFWAKRVSEPEQVVPPRPPTSVGVVGWPKAVDAVATLPAARALTRRSQLRGIVFDGVSVEGTLDLTNPAAHVRYAFQSPAGHGPQPPRVPGMVPRRNLCGRQNVELASQGMAAAPDQADLPCPPSAAEPLPMPQCSLAQIWERALAKGAARSALARIEYYRASAGPAWRFELPDGALRFSVYGDCKRELSRSEANGNVP